MGNYKDIELEFVERTTKLLSQYNVFAKTQIFEKQYNYTLLINCLLGLIVMPKERVVTYIPTTELTSKYKAELGLKHSIIGGHITTLQNLIIRLRHSVAHFDIEVLSSDNKELVDFIVFNETNGSTDVVAKFCSKELSVFLHNYSHLLQHAIKTYRNRFAT